MNEFIINFIRHSFQIGSKKPKILVIDEQQMVSHQGECQIQINMLSKCLLVIPENEGGLPSIAFSFLTNK